uniref:BTB domain-containing protein n=2 Tax=Gibberella zeae (strain ATCC MYA-4620 / CBS 123657 / FGSC 9075 / NRRL 31084 / PH-1) TaxID=229533 RepID=A0A098D143_GIBZE
MRVSSRHLILASRTFRTMLEGPWKECLAVASKNQSGPVLIETSDWDAAALAIVLDAIHGRYQDIPKHVGIGLMTRIATIVDYYECHECLQLISDIWMADIWGKNEVPDTFCKSSLLWLYTSWVFSRPNIMDLMSRVLLQDTLDPSHINLKDLPLGQILGLISQYRLIMTIALTQDRKNW